ncbi:hypothetical protein vseg_008309 [Gypsophila vaccaria]
MVAKTPPTSQRKLMVVAPPLSPTVFRQTLRKVDECMARLEEMQYTIRGGGNKVIGGVSKPYFKTTTLRSNHDSLIRVRNNATKRSPTAKLPASLTGEWRRMSLTSMLVGETVAEILQTSKLTKQIMGNCDVNDPKTPLHRKQMPSHEKTPIETRRKREKQHRFRVIQAEFSTPSVKRARSRINFKVSPPKRAEIEREKGARYNSLANRVSPKHKPWAKKTVLFPNPVFHSSPTSQKTKFFKTRSPVIEKKREVCHKFLVKSPVKIRSQQKGYACVSPVAKMTGLSRKSPQKQQMSTASKVRRSLSPSRLVSRMVSPLKGRRNSVASSSSALMMMPMRFSASKR